MLQFVMKYKEEIHTVSEVIQALTPFVLGVVSFCYYKIIKERSLKDGDAALEVKDSFWTLRTPKILAVHKFEKSNDSSGYKHDSQNSRPDQWRKLIEITSTGWLLKRVVRLDESDLLKVIISRNGKEKWKTISFME